MEFLHLCFAFLAAVCALEALCYVAYRGAVRRAQELTVPPKVTKKERDELFNKIFLMKPLSRTLAGWFLTNDREFSREDVRDLLAWAFHYKPLAELSEDELEWVDRATTTVYCALQSEKVQSGQSDAEGPAVSLEKPPIMKYNLAPVKPRWRPAAAYVFVWALKRVTGWILLLRGYRRHSMNKVSYWLRDLQNTSEEDRLFDRDDAVVLFHGIGVGWFSYLPLVFALKAQKVVLFDMPWITMDPLAEAIDAEVYTAEVVRALQRHSVKKATFVGHSFGCLAVAWLLRRSPHVVSHAALLDPVALLLNLPDVCYNFLYRTPHSWMDKAFKFVVREELSICRTLRRHFWWTEGVLFPDMLPKGSVVVLSEQDAIVPTHEIYRSCSKIDTIETAVLRKMPHAGFLFHPKSLQTVVRLVNGCHKTVF